MSIPEGDLEKKKTEKYDRQLRLWGVEGQSKIETAHICVLNGGPVGSETLKNLVLPGIGEFTIIDNKKVSNRDLGNNFFVELESVGKSRAEEVTRLLYELNDMVREKHAIEKDPEALIESNPDFVKDYTVIIATELSPTAVLKLSAACSKHNKPLVVIRANGLIGYIRVQAGEHTIVQSKPSFPLEDLRLNTPFPTLVQFAQKVDYAQLDDMHYAHIPFPVILLKEVDTWKASHDGQLPVSDAEKDAFRAQVRHRKRKSENENFDEAAQKAHFAWLPYRIPSSIADILNDPKAVTTTAHSSNFWLLANAVKHFVENEGQGKLPLMGTIPDMTSDTLSFIDLQYIYREKSLEDAAIVKQHLHANLTKLGLSKERISDDDIKNFCKHTLFLQVIRYSTIVDEQDSSKVDKNSIAMSLVDQLSGDDSPGEGCWYIALRAADKFHQAHGRYPGEKTDSYGQDFEDLRKFADEVLKDLEIDPSQVNDAYLKELCRFGNSQIHNIAAILGGISAQEVIKLVASQWVPLDNTFIFNGINSTSVALKI